jgi:hypothetical protein
VPDRNRPPIARDCLDCGLKDGMKLQNPPGLPSTRIPLLYVCARCGVMLTIPPPQPAF